MSNDTEILPPARRPTTPTTRDDLNGVSSPKSVLLTGLHARLQTRAHREIAENIRAQNAILEAETTRRASALRLLRTTQELREAPEILALDHAEREHERAQRHHDLETEQAAREAERTQRLIKAQEAMLDAQHDSEMRNRLRSLELELEEERARGRLLRERYENATYEHALRNSESQGQAENERMIAVLQEQKTEALQCGDYERAGRIDLALAALGVE